MKKKNVYLNHILVATDFSRQAEVALLRAAELAKSYCSSLIVLHIAKNDLLEDLIIHSIPATKKILLSSYERASAQLDDHIKKLSNKIEIKKEILFGDNPAIKILNYVKKNKIDLVLIGAHGEHTLHDWFVGTTAEYISKKIDCPVLILKNKSYRSYKNILIPVDFSFSSKNALDFCLRLYPKVNKKILHVTEIQYENVLLKSSDIPKEKIMMLRKAILQILTQKMANFLKSLNFLKNKVKTYIKFGYPGKIIVEEAKHTRSDLIVMGTKGYNRRHYLMMGRVANKVLIETDKDILLVPIKK